VRAYLGLGSNLGDRLENLLRAVRLLQDAPGVVVLRSSRVYETEPVGGPEQPDYLNAVVEIDAGIAAHALLDACLGIEDAVGRVRGELWGPRTIDVDILTYGGTTIDDGRLTVPHPRMQERMFVLAPLLELDDDPLLPGGRQISTMRLDRVDVSGARTWAPPLVVGV